MKTCVNCQRPLDDSFSVCPYCGAPADAGTPSQPIAPQQPFYPAPPMGAVPYEAPPADPATLARPSGVKPLILGIAGLACGIFSFSFAILAAVVGFFFGAVDGSVGGMFGVVYGIVAFAAAIPGLICSILGRRAASDFTAAVPLPSGKVKAGRIMAGVGIGLSAAGMAFAVISIVLGGLLISSGVNYYDHFVSSSGADRFY